MIRPRYYSQYVIIVSFLMFTIITFNSFSAYITSILSVQLVNIRDVEDLLESDYEIGYIKNSDDEVYLRVSNLIQWNSPQR